MNDLRQRLVELRDGWGWMMPRADCDTLTEAVNELARLQEGSQYEDPRIERVREWAESAEPLPTDATDTEKMRDPYGDAAREVLSLLNTPPEDSP